MHGTDASTEHSPTTPEVTGPKSWALLGVTLAAQALVVIDISVVNTALPTIGTSLRLGGSELQWLVTAYLMMSGGGLLLGGRLADLLSKRRVFFAGLMLFTVASLVSGFAGSGAELIVARAVQGLSAALLTPAALSLVMTTYTGAQRNTALALWGAVGSLGVAAGVLFGGALTTWTGWHVIFWINAPIGVAALLVGARVIEADQPVATVLSDFDLPGAITVLGSLTTLVYGLAQTASHGWWSIEVVGSFAASAVLGTTFLRLEQRSARPLFPPHVWRIKTLVTGTGVMLGVTGMLVGAVFLTSIFLQTVLGFSALETGLAFLPFALALTAGTVVAKHLLVHLSPRALAVTGFTLAAAAAGLLLSAVSPDATYVADVLPALLGLGLGFGLVFVPVSVTAMAGIPDAHAGVASGFLMTGHEVGAALGVAVLSAVASTAGSLSASSAAQAFSRGLVGEICIAALFASVAYLRMSGELVSGTQVHLHH